MAKTDDDQHDKPNQGLLLMCNGKNSFKANVDVQ